MKKFVLALVALVCFACVSDAALIRRGVVRRNGVVFVGNRFVAVAPTVGFGLGFTPVVNTFGFNTFGLNSFGFNNVGVVAAPACAGTTLTGFNGGFRTVVFRNGVFGY
jgi:hypothetical protein